MCLVPGAPVTVRLVKAPRPDRSYPASVLADDGVHVVIRAPWAGPVRDFGFVRFVPGDVLVEHYWRDRWYAVKEVRDAAGALRGWYCDVTRPTRVHDGVLEVRDLELDLWVPADRSRVVRLDEDEFLASGLPERIRRRQNRPAARWTSWSSWPTPASPGSPRAHRRRSRRGTGPARPGVRPPGGCPARSSGGHPGPVGVRVEGKGPVRTVVLSRPERRNAVDGATARALADAFRAFDADDEAAVAVLWGEGGTFCSGADLKAFATPSGNRVEPDGRRADGPHPDARSASR